MTDIRARIKTIIERELSVDNQDEISGVNDAVYALTALFSEREKELKDALKSRFNDWLIRGEQIADLRREIERLTESCYQADKDKEAQADCILHDSEKIRELRRQLAEAVEVIKLAVPFLPKTKSFDGFALKKG